MEKNHIKMSTAILWVIFYFLVMLFYTFLDITVWRTLFSDFSVWLNLFCIVLCVVGFLQLLKRKTGFKLPSSEKITVKGFLLAIGCSLLFYLLLDCCIDTILENLFPTSEQSYQETIQALRHSPITSFLQVCIIAPIVEETLMRGFVLGGLRERYGAITALLVSSLLFSVLHFNMVQTLSAFLCGLILGLLYLKTESVECCMLAHFGYNFISYVVLFIYV